MKNKLDPSYSKKTSGETDTVDIEPPKESLQCVQCEYKGTCKLDIRKHIGSKDKTIPQLDGHMDGETKEHMECKEKQTVPLPDSLHIQEDSPGWDVWCLGQDFYCDPKDFYNIKRVPRGYRKTCGNHLRKDF